MWKLKRNAKMHPEITEFMCYTGLFMFGSAIIGLSEYLMCMSNSLPRIIGLIVTAIAILLMIVGSVFICIPIFEMDYKKEHM
jgi:hypothetical protein